MENKTSQIDFNRLDKLIKFDDPRMKSLDKDVVFERSKKQYERIAFVRNGTDSKFKITYDGQDWVFRPLAGMEEFQCEQNALDDYEKLSIHKRTDVYKQYRIIIHKLSCALSSCPEDITGIPLNITQLECLPLPYIMGLWAQYEKLMLDINPDIDNLTQKDLDDIIKVISESPKYLSNCTLKQLQLICLELLKTNIILRGN